MKTAGIIAEYNPFHEGHRYHIEKTRALTGADYVIVVMSGDFVQRGDPACTDKYMRTGMALAGGADLVIELPVYFATASAEAFAAAGVELLDSLSCVDWLSFGSEWAVLDDYQDYIRILSDEGEEYRRLLKKHLKEGQAFPAARSLALQSLLPETNDAMLTDRFLKEPNHILGLEYLKALQRIHSRITPLVIPRKGAAYHETGLHPVISSAAGIRKAMKDKIEGKADHLPDLKAAIGKDADRFLNHTGSGESVSWQDLMPLLDYEMLMHESVPKGETGQKRQTEKTSGDDLTNRIRKLYRPGMEFEELIALLHSRNRTDTALKRALIHILLGLDPGQLKKRQDIGLLVPYARVLGFKKDASDLLRKVRRKSRIPVIQRPAAGRELLKGTPEDVWMYRKDLQAGDLYEQIAARKAGRQVCPELAARQVIF